MTSQPSQFELVLSGIADDGDTRDKVKQILIDQLSFNEQGVEVFLDNVPIAIKKADEESQLQAVLDALVQAGAQAHISAPKPSSALKLPQTLALDEDQPEAAPASPAKTNGTAVRPSKDKEAKLSDLIAKNGPKISEGEAASGAIPTPSAAVKMQSSKETPPPRKTSSRFVMFGGIVAVIGLVGFFLMPAPHKPGRTSIGPGPKQKQEAKAAPDKKPAESEKAPETVVIQHVKASWKVEHDFTDQKIEGRLDVSDGKVVGGDFSVSTPPPAELTPEEIVRGVQKAPWVQKLRTITLNFKHLEDGGFEGSGRAKGTMDHLGKIIPIFCDFSMTGKIDPETKFLAARIWYHSGMDDSGEDHVVKAEEAENGFNYLIAANVEGNKIEPGDESASPPAEE